MKYRKIISLFIMLCGTNSTMSQGTVSAWIGRKVCIGYLSLVAAYTVGSITFFVGMSGYQIANRLSKNQAIFSRKQLKP